MPVVTCATYVGTGFVADTSVIRVMSVVRCAACTGFVADTSIVRVMSVTSVMSVAGVVRIRCVARIT